MDFSINLIRKRLAGIQRQRRLQWLIQIISIVALGVFFVLSSVVLSYFYLLKRKMDTLDRKIVQEETEVKSQQAKETKVIYLNKKLTSLSSILKSQELRQKQAEAVFSLIPEGVGISKLNFQEGSEVELQGEALDFSSLEKLFENILKSSQQGRSDLALTGVYVEEIEHDKEKGYTFTLRISLKKAET